MEGSGKKMRAICVMLVIMLSMSARETEAFSGKCYAKCLFFCVLNPFHPAAECAVKCLAKCIFKPQGSSASATTLSLNDQLHKQCTFGCAKTKCANITTSLQNIGKHSISLLFLLCQKHSVRSPHLYKNLYLN